MATVKFDFTNTTTVITGGCSGIGLCCALAIVEAGGNVIVTSSRDTIKTTTALQLLSDKKKKKIGITTSSSSTNNDNNIQHINAYSCNVGDETSVATFFENVNNTICSTSTGRLDYVIHCAGISPNTEFLNQTQTEWDTVHNVNSTGSFLVIKYAAEIMKQQQLKKVISNNFILNNINNNSNNVLYESRGSILLVSSTNGINSNDSISAHYDSSKASVNMLVRNSCEYLTCNYNIIVNGIAPGWINTDMNNTLPTYIRDKETSKIWTKRWSTPEEIAIAIMHTLTMPYYVGQTLLVDGGYR